MYSRSMPATNFGSHASRRAAAVALLLGAAALGCRSSPPPSIVWIVVDTLRADHLTQYGYDRDTSLTLAPLVEDGVRFENAYSPHPETTPAIAAALTGLYPPHNGLRVLYWRLDASNVTAAELLHRAGYETAGFVSSFVMVDDFNGFAQGFDVYDDRVTDRELYRENYERKAAKTVAAARRWLARRDRDKPFFLFVHLIDPHGPYAPPGNWSERFHSQGSVRIRGRVPRYQRIPGVDDLRSEERRVGKECRSRWSPYH